MIAVLMAICALQSSSVGHAPEPIIFQLTKPDRPGKLTAELFTGTIRVRGRDTPDIVVRARVGPGTVAPVTVMRADGLKRIGAGFSLDVEESDNHARISVSANRDPIHLIIEVPRHLALSLTSRRGGDLIIRDIEGEIEARADQGNIFLDDIGGPVTAYAPYGEISGSLTRSNPGSAMSFSSLRGDIDLSLPADIVCELRMTTRTGEVFSDFEMRVARHTEKRGGTRDRDGRFRAGFENALVAVLAGGGPRISMTSMTGNLYIRSAEPRGAGQLER